MGYLDLHLDYVYFSALSLRRQLFCLMYRRYLGTYHFQSTLCSKALD